MKLHMSISQADLAGYTNIDATKIPIDLAKLDGFCEEAECTDIIINDLLKFMPYEQLPLVLQHICSRLRHGGKATFIFTDFNSIIREFNVGTVDEKLCNQLLFAHGAKSCFGYKYIERILKAIRVNITSIEIDTEQVIITIERP